MCVKVQKVNDRQIGLDPDLIVSPCWSQLTLAWVNNHKKIMKLLLLSHFEDSSSGCIYDHLIAVAFTNRYVFCFVYRCLSCALSMKKSWNCSASQISSWRVSYAEMGRGMKDTSLNQSTKQLHLWERSSSRVWWTFVVISLLQKASPTLRGKKLQTPKRGLSSWWPKSTGSLRRCTSCWGREKMR